MSIDFDRFLNWAESRFDNVLVRGDEVLLNSIFCEDRKHHLWCNPSGGKTNNQNGVYHCWKSDQKGNLVGLVMLVDKCSYEQAIETLDAISEGSLEDLERRVQELFNTKNDEKVIEEKPSGLQIPSDCYLFEDLPSFNNLRKLAEDYIVSRKISKDRLYICTKGRYRNRIVIPYYDNKGNLIYYNGRYIGDPGKNLRYLGPPKELGIGKGDVMFVPNWPTFGEKIYITEGEFDALSLSECGFKSAALGGKNMTEKQIEMIKGFVPVLALDADEAGSEALPKIAKNLMSKGFSKIYYVRPCREYKDWNGLLVAKGDKILRHYVASKEKEYISLPGAGDWESTKIAMENLIK